MDALEFLKVAKELINGSEANWRMSIGRSYYAVFNHLKKSVLLWVSLFLKVQKVIMFYISISITLVFKKRLI